MNAYFPMSTANPTGQRPWNFMMQGGLGRLPVRRVPIRRRAMGRLGRLGDSTASYLPSGSILSYTATWPASFGDPMNITNAIQSTLTQQWGITINSESDNTSFFSVTSSGFTLNVQTQRDYGSAGDVKSILDSVVGAAVGAPGLIGNGYGSTIANVTQSQAVISPQSTGAPTVTIDPNTGLAITTASSIDPMTWLTQNFTTVAIFFGALVLLPPLIKKL